MKNHHKIIDLLNNFENCFKNHTVNELLHNISDYYQAEHAYIIVNYHDNISLAYEFFNNGQCHYEKFQNYAIKDLQYHLSLLKEKGFDIIENYIINNIKINKAIIVPIIEKEQILGIIGINDPKEIIDIEYLQVAAYICKGLASDIYRINNSQIIDRMNVIQSLSEIYTSVYYIDLDTKVYTELSSISTVHSYIGTSGNAQANLNFFCHHMMDPSYTDSMLEFVDLNTLNDRLQNKIISKQYLSNMIVDENQKEPLKWTQCNFIEVDRHDDNSLHHVIFATQNIDDAKTNELNAKKALEEKNQELQNLLISEKQHTAIIDSLSKAFFALYLINIDQHTIQNLNDKTNKLPLDLFIDTMINKYISSEYQANMRTFTNIDTLLTRIQNKDIISQEYHDINAQWIRCSFIPLDITNTEVIFGFRKITKEKEEYVIQESLIQALSINYDNVYAINIKTKEAKCYRMSKDINNLYGQHFANGNYEDLILQYIEHEVYYEDKYLFENIKNVDKIKELLALNNNISFNYRIYRNNDIHYFRCQVVKPNNNRNEFAIAFENIDEEKQKELAQQKIISDALTKVQLINEELNIEMELANILSKDYPFALILDINNDNCYHLKRDGKMLNKEDREIKYSYQQAWNEYINTYVLKEDVNNLLTATSKDNIIKALKDHNEYSCSFRIVTNNIIHHIQAVYISFYSNFAKDYRIILGFRNVDNIVEQEIRHSKIQEEQLRIIDALSQEYHSLFKIDCKNANITLYRSDGVGMKKEVIDSLIKVSDYDTILANYINNYVIDDDKERMLQATKLTTLIEQVPEVGLYKMNYRRNLDGVLSYYEMNIAKTYDEDQNIIFIMGLRDVNEQMQLRLKQAREIETKNEIIEGLGSEYYSILLVDLNNDKVTTYRKEDEDGIAIDSYFNKYDYCWSKGLASYALELVSDNSREEFIEKLSNLKNNHQDYSFTYEKNNPDGITYLQVRISYVKEKDGDYVCVIGTRSVDDLIKKEKQQELALKEAFDAAELANRAKTDFLSNMSHDIRTPMNGIIGMTAIAAAHIDDHERIKDCLNKITTASKHLLSLINEVLDMSKIESGKVELFEEEFNIADLIDNLLTITNPQIAKHHHELHVNIHDVIHERVIGDSFRIQKVFTNLMSNAVKFTPDGGIIKLTVKEKKSNQNKVGCYEFIFEDNGIGMSKEYIKHIFEPFSREQIKRVNNIQGTGLGMTISRNIVRMMGGDIKVESELNKGSKFTVTIYLKLQNDEDIKYDKFIDLNILVADDDKISLESCCDILDSFGMNTTGVTSGQEAVDSIVLHHKENDDYFACIIDWKMPDMDGITTAKAIRKQVGNEVPIIIISAYDWSNIEKEAKEAGVNAFISKPLFKSKLANTFNELIQEDANILPNSIDNLSALNFKNKKALLVEDNDLNAEIAKEILMMTGLKVELAKDGMEAIEMIEKNKHYYYDIIFMDIQMPRMNGYDATRVIRAMNNEYCKKIPIIAMSANAFAEDVQSAKTVGMNQHIAKPLNFKDLANTLNQYLKDE